MRRLVVLMVGCLVVAVCAAEDDDAKPTVAIAKAVAPTVGPAGAANASGRGTAPAPGSPARFTSEAKWQKAGYTLD
jgi:hypothetical protein